jgi:hypothetical protein
LFATEDGTIVGWNPNVNPSPTQCSKGKNSTFGIIAVDNSATTYKKSGSKGAVYKGLAIATAEDGETFLFATNFRAGWVEKYDANFSLLDTFTDKKVPDGYAPFNIVPITIGAKLSSW